MENANNEPHAAGEKADESANENDVSIDTYRTRDARGIWTLREPFWVATSTGIGSRSYVAALTSETCLMCGTFLRDSATGLPAVPGVIDGHTCQGA